MEEKLIEAVRCRKVLYDTSDVNYMKTKLKQQLWEEIAKGIGLKTDFAAGSEAKIMWEKLRHSFRDAIRRQQKCIRSGAAATSQKQWKCQKEMGFLQRYMVNRERDTNFSDANDEELQMQDYEELEGEDDFEAGTEAHSLDLEHKERDHEDIPPTNLRCTSMEKAPTVPRQETVSNIPGCSMKKTPIRQSQIHKKDNIGILFKRSIENREKREQQKEQLREK
ncbi:hypothetical protein NQ314_010204 [Rhamnusium bicolor]|uniref:MADF domain-containing protein n=1 Tax=Rhamnusium bicolor TaxID=1586634 RepID=A0AAV8XSX7_9CUCU|nr:hypothetical protein NQ314_010204 [Rhamnusium bicolor]